MACRAVPCHAVSGIFTVDLDLDIDEARRDEVRRGEMKLGEVLLDR